MASISLRNVVKRYRTGKTEIQVIHGVSAEIADHEFIVIVGPSGCGKSTLLRMVAGLEDISGGDIAIGPRVVNTLEPAERDIAMVFQNYALYPHMSVFDNMAYGLKIKKVPPAEIAQRVDKAAAILELGHLLQRKPRELSGGQRQRVAMGRAIVRDPQVFLFDEPLSNLDAKLRVTMRVENIFRYAHVFPRCVAMLSSGAIDVKPLITRTFRFDDSVRAFEIAASAPAADVKMQIVLPQ